MCSIRIICWDFTLRTSRNLRLVYLKLDSEVSSPKQIKLLLFDIIKSSESKNLETVPFNVTRYIEFVMMESVT